MFSTFSNYKSIRRGKIEVEVEESDSIFITTIIHALTVGEELIILSLLHYFRSYILLLRYRDRFRPASEDSSDGND